MVPTLHCLGLGWVCHSPVRQSASRRITKWLCYSRGSKELQNPRVPGLFSAQELHVSRMESSCTPHFGWGNRSGRSTLHQHLMPRVFDHFIPGSQGGELTVFRGPAEWSQSLETPKFAFLLFWVGSMGREFEPRNPECLSFQSLCHGFLMTFALDQVLNDLFDIERRQHRGAKGTL